MRFLKVTLIVICGIVTQIFFVDAATPPPGAAKGIKDTKHNLSNWGPGDVKAAGTTLKDTEVCIFCHTPHNADSTQVPLWGHKDTTATGFIMASSFWVKPTATGVDTEPTSISKKCLSCHDGTIAVGALTGGDIGMTGGATDKLNADGTLKGPRDASHPGYLGTDLRSGHVISFVYDTVTKPGPAGLKAWINISTQYQNSMFDRQGRMQCHSCHDPHTDWCTEIDDATPGTVGRDPLWRKKCNSSGKNSSVCEVCHLTTFAGYTQGPPW